MEIIDVEELLKKVSNRYELVNLAAKRAKQLMSGHSPLINGVNEEKVNIIALKEIKENKVILKRKDETQEPYNKEQKIEEGNK